MDQRAIREQHGLSVPPRYRLFVESFAWREELIKDKDFWHLPSVLDPRLGGNGEIYFRPRIQRIEEMLEWFDGGDEMVERKVLLFASNRFGVYIGTKGKDRDRVLMKEGDLDGGWVTVAKDVFEFMAGVTDNLQEVANSADEYRSICKALGAEGEELDDEVEYWLNHHASDEAKKEAAERGDDRRFEFKKGTSSKFWTIGIQGSKVTTTWGRVGTGGQSKTKSHASAGKAQEEYDKLVSQKTKKGYTEATKKKASKKKATKKKVAKKKADKQRKVKKKATKKKATKKKKGR
ncbi:MAG: WGR domain-containing protein [Planctomycetes bacterium]|nr:WGR domain-containing protein [Planctomycetota bacterium]